MFLKCVKSNYSFRYKLPNDVRCYFNNRSELVVSLKTKDVTIAKVKALELAAHTKTIIGKIRFMHEMGMNNIDDIVKEWLEEKLQRDFEARLRQSSIKGLSDDELPTQKQESYSEEVYYRLKDDMKHFRLRGVTSLAKDLLSDSFDVDSAQHKEFMFKLLQANVTLFEELHKRNQGQYNFKLQGTKSSKTKKSNITYGEAIEKYIRYMRNTKMTEDFKVSVEPFLKHTFKVVMGADNYIADYWDECMEDINNLSLVPKNANGKIRNGSTLQMLLDDEDRISKSKFATFVKWSKAFFVWAKANNFTEGDVAGSFLKVTKGSLIDNRDILSDDEVLQLFTKAKQENEDTYTIIKVLAYTGMRHSEFFKMRIEDDYFDLQYKGCELKSESSRRIIPIHDDLKDIDKNYLYELTTKCKLRSFSRTAMRILRSITDDPNKVVYSLRHSFATKLQNVDVDMQIISQLMGHAKGKTMTEKVYAKGYKFDKLVKAINKLKYPSSLH